MKTIFDPRSNSIRAFQDLHSCYVFLKENETKEQAKQRAVTILSERLALLKKQQERKKKAQIKPGKKKIRIKENK